MKIAVYFLYCEEEDKLRSALDKVELDGTFEKIYVHWPTDTVNENRTRLLEKWKDRPPGVFVCIHPSFEPFVCLNSLPYEYRRRWLFYQKVDDFQPQFVLNCYVNYISEHTNDCNPLLSVITTTYKSKHRILRPYQSLLDQTYANWEWVIVDDTDGSQEEMDEQWSMLQNLEKSDVRIRAYKPARHSGYIGEMKKFACGLAKGEWLLELDHDDDIVPELLQWIVNSIRQHPNASFIYSDCIEVYEDNMQDFHYGEFFGMGYGAYYTTLYKNRFQHVCLGVPINRVTVSHIVGVPNHIRCWKTLFYHSIGGHNPHLPVADDYELLLRTFLHSDTWVRIAELGYIQYRNRNGNNFTFLRNQLIQDLVRLTYAKHADALSDRFIKLLEGTKNCDRICYLEKPIFKYHELSYFPLEKIYIPNEPDDRIMFSIILPTFNRADALINAMRSVIQQTYPHWILYVIGDKCPVLNGVMDAIRESGQYHPQIRWWNLSENHGAGGAVPRNYGLTIAQTEWVAYLDDDNTWNNDHLASMAEAIKRDNELKFVFSSFNVDGKPFVTQYPVWGGLDTSAVVHKRDLIYKYGLWKDRNEANYNHDYEYFSRFEKEKWFATGKATMNYSTKFNQQSLDMIQQLYNFNKDLFLKKNSCVSEILDGDHP
jgi:glycosyltransferase involved in cell wall biosynthesis